MSALSDLHSKPWADREGVSTEREDALDLIIYPIEDEDEQLAFAGLRATEAVLSRVALIAAAALFGWMLIGIALARHAGRI